MLCIVYIDEKMFHAAIQFALKHIQKQTLPPIIQNDQRKKNCLLCLSKNVSLNYEAKFRGNLVHVPDFEDSSSSMADWWSKQLYNLTENVLNCCQPDGFILTYNSPKLENASKCELDQLPFAPSGATTSGWAIKQRIFIFLKNNIDRPINEASIKLDTKQVTYNRNILIFWQWRHSQFISKIIFLLFESHHCIVNHSAIKTLLFLMAHPVRLQIQWRRITGQPNNLPHCNAFQWTQTH